MLMGAAMQEFAMSTLARIMRGLFDDGQACLLHLYLSIATIGEVLA